MTVAKATLLGMISFTLVSLGGFAVWAFAGGWFYKNVGEYGLYAVSAIVFVVLSGLLMHPLVQGPRRVVRFYVAFVPAFLVYAIVWCAAWYFGKAGKGEWIGSIAGAAAFALVLAAILKSSRGLLAAIVVLAITHSAGYFAGGKFYENSRDLPVLKDLSRSQRGLVAKLGWGFFYGLGFGAGIGFAFWSLQKSTARKADASSA